MPKSRLYNEYVTKVNNIDIINMNLRQKELIKDILGNANDQEIAEWYQLLLIKVKTGFNFDENVFSQLDKIALIKELPKFNIRYIIPALNND